MYENYDEVLDLYSAWLIARAAGGWKVVDIHGPMHMFLYEIRKTQPGYVLAGDGVHANAQGHWLMARGYLTFMGFLASDSQPETLEQALKPFGDKEALVELIRQKQRILSDAWLTKTGHLRPGMSKGLPLDEANSKAEELESLIQSVLPK